MITGGIRAEMGFLVKIAEKLPIKSLQHVLSLNDRLTEYGATAIERQKDHIAKSGDSVHPTLFSKLVDPTRNQELSTPAITAEAGNLIVAGSDTTAVSLTYLVWSLLRPQHQHVRETLLKEISSVPAEAGMSEISSLTYLRAVVDESLRLYGAAPGSLPRTTPSEGAQLGDHFIPAGTTVSIQAYTLHRDESIFLDPEEFRPERWHNPTQQMKDAFMPFGAGSRICLGIHLALQELLLGTFVFFKTCPTARLAASTTDESMEIENYFLIAPKSHRCEIVL